MSTLTTRIGGYKFIVEKKYGIAMGAFNSETDNFMDLPFELRSTYRQEQGQIFSILAAAVDAVNTLDERTTYAAEFHPQDCGCDNCMISLALLRRQFGTLRSAY